MFIICILTIIMLIPFQVGILDANGEILQAQLRTENIVTSKGGECKYNEFPLEKQYFNQILRL